MRLLFFTRYQYVTQLPHTLRDTYGTPMTQNPYLSTAQGRSVFWITSGFFGRVSRRCPMTRIFDPKTKRLSSLKALSLPRWCPGRDSNPHTFRRQNLNLVRLPISPPGQAGGFYHRSLLPPYTLAAHARRPLRELPGCLLSSARQTAPADRGDLPFCPQRR
jgi:hypothetical protein